MSRKATKTTRAAAKALAGSNRVQRDAREAADARRLAEDAVRAAISAACAAERTGATAGVGASGGDAGLRRVARDVRACAEEAVERARDAMRAEGEGDVVGAASAAEQSLRAARHAGSLAAEASVIAGKARDVASAREAAEPAITVGERRGVTPRERPADPIAAAIERASRYLVTYDGAVVAALAREEDAFLLESELADLDRAHGTETGKCEIIERRSGRRLGGYLLTGGHMLVFLRDDNRERRFGKRR